ncbi:CD3324 family protein (plasmid) [Pseudalkalibacillus hwajinpoensis]|uniref:CD3324 family protein n=1 Tax=Guptibacillus hwajinpoensis TaxID=208199 RepID=UPI00325C220A
MNYVKANDVLPEELITEIQKYVQGKTLYIPKLKGNYEKWGECSGIRAYIKARNLSLKKDFAAGATFESLMEKYWLSEETIKKVVYSTK